MDYNHICTNSAGNISPTFENNFAHDPSFYPDPYLRRSGPFVNSPGFVTPNCSRFSNFPPEHRPPSVKNRNVRYHPYNPRFTSFQEADYRGSKACHDWSYCPETEGNCLCCSQKMHPNTGRGNCHGSNNRFKSTVTKKRQKPRNSKIQGNFPALNSDNNRQANYAVNALDINRQENYAANAIHNSPQKNSTHNATVHDVPNKEVIMKIKDKNDCNKLPVANEQKHFVDDWSCEGTIETAINNTETHMIYANGSENTISTAKDIGLNSEYQNDPLLNNATNALEAGTDVLLTAMTIAGINNLQSEDNLDLSNCQTAHITMPENTNIQNTQQEILEYTDIENSFFKTVFEGKDENGEDIVILLADPDMQKIVNNEINAGTFAYNANLNTGINQNITLNFTENNTVSDQTSSEFNFDTQQINQEYDEYSQDMFSSDIDDHASEEIVTTSKAPKTKKTKTKTKKDITRDRIQEATVKQSAVESDAVTNCVSETSASREGEDSSTNMAQNVNSSLKELKARKRNRRWNRRFQWKSSKPFFNIQRQYFGKLVKRAKMENKPLMTDERFWNMYRIIVNRIGGSVMGAIYNILPALIHNYETLEQKANASAEKLE